MNLSNKKAAKASKVIQKQKQQPSGNLLKKMKLIQKGKGKYVLEVDEIFVNQLQQAQQLLTEINETLMGTAEIKAEDGQESIQRIASAGNVDIEEEGSSSGSEEKSAAPQSNQHDQPQQQSEVKETQDFYRRIPHFFMGRFKKWAKILNETEVSQFLNKLKDGKKSKQGRYELGDFHRCFQIDKNDSQEQQKQKKKIKELFLEFLQNEAVLQIIQYNKITNQDQKIKYIDVIPNMVQEMYSEKPFDQFLAQQNIEKQLNKKKQLLAETQEQKQPQKQDDESAQMKGFKNDQQF